MHDGNKTLMALRSRLLGESGDSVKLLHDLKDNPICSVTVDETVPCIKVVWKQYATSTQLRFVHESVLHLIQKHRVNKILGDDTALPTIVAEDQAWIADNWMPRAVAAGLKFAGTKYPESYFGRISVNSVQAAVPKGMVVRSFESVEDARRWLSARHA